ncbi:hypothetical protein RDI58_014942 [Solanum bulbocastanum]|uniref:Uncharacterized protein n=1 Tax=Solanum bulbocastanum TaxID=147425 RepID=A0AAN8YBH5_SOLBU
MHSVSPIDNISALFQKQLLPINHVQSMLSDRLFRIQLRKSYWRDSYVPNIPLSVLSYTEKEVIFPPTVDEKIKKVKPRSTSEIALTSLGNFLVVTFDDCKQNFLGLSSAFLLLDFAQIDTYLFKEPLCSL